MRRPFRVLFTFAAGVSLVLCVATVVLWVRSYGGIRCVAEVNPATPPGGGVAIMALMDQGRIVVIGQSPFRRAMIDPVARSRRQIGFWTFTPPLNDPPSWAWLRTAGPETFRREAAGFIVQATPGWMWLVTVPCWAVVIATNIVPAAWVLRRRRALGTQRLGFCLRCGYDLRATPDRCPECGTAPKTAHEKPAG